MIWTNLNFLNLYSSLSFQILNTANITFHARSNVPKNRIFSSLYNLQMYSQFIAFNYCLMWNSINLTRAWQLWSVKKIKVCESLMNIFFYIHISLVLNNYEISFWNLQGLTSHGVVIKCVDNGKKNRKKGEEPLNIGVVKPKISDIGSRLSRKFSSKNEHNKR